MASDRLGGKTAIVTGGGAGQGRKASELFAAEGARVLIGDVDLPAAQEVATAITESGGTASALQVDVSSETDVQTMVERAITMFGSVDVLLNNAGIGFSAGSHYTMAGVADTPADDWDAILAINLKGAALTCKHVLPVMAERGGGAVVNTSSINGMVAMPGADAYTAAKGGIIALTRVLASDWAPRGVRVNCICPGAVDTAMIRDALAGGFDATVAHRTPLGRAAQPDEIAPVALFLASEEASYVNGVVLPIDGGWTAC